MVPQRRPPEPAPNVAVAVGHRYRVCAMPREGRVVEFQRFLLTRVQRPIKSANNRSQATHQCLHWIEYTIIHLLC